MDIESSVLFETEKEASAEAKLPEEKTGGKRAHNRVSLLLVFLPALIAVALAVALFSKEGPLIGALEENAAGYEAIFHGVSDFSDAFSRAVMLSQADIAVFFLSLLFPYTAASRPLTVATSLLRTWLTALAAVSVVKSPLAALSLSAGLAPTYYMLYRADTMYVRIRERGAFRPYIWDLSCSGAGASVCSGVVIALRAILLFTSMLIPG